MAYTIPEYVDTQEQAILAVASAVKGEQVTGGDGNVGTALDILADALAGENVEVPMTQQGAILALAQYVGGGGGCVGQLMTVLGEGTGVPEVGNMLDDYPIVASVRMGESVICDAEANAGAYLVAAGVTAVTVITPPVYATAVDAYVCTFEGSDADGWEYKTVEPWDGTITREEVEYQGDACYRWAFTVPELQDGEWLILWAYLAD